MSLNLSYNSIECIEHLQVGEVKMMLGLENRDLEHQAFRGETINYSLRLLVQDGKKVNLTACHLDKL